MTHAVDTWLDSAAFASAAYISWGTETVVRMDLAMAMGTI
jgi:hypothetical protein